MTDIREKLAEVAEEAIDNVHDMDVRLRDYAEAATDGILAALPGCVPELDWSGGNSACLDFPCSYSFDGDDDDGWTVTLSYRACDVNIHEEDATFPTLEAAKAAANAHHVAALMAALGVSTPHDVTKPARDVTSPDQIGE